MKLKIAVQAKSDIKDASRWYDEQQRGLGRKFTTIIKEEIRSIALNPEQIPYRYKNIRAAVVTVFPYTIHFYISHEKQMIFVTGVFHTSLNPKKWDR